MKIFGSGGVLSYGGEDVSLGTDTPMGIRLDTEFQCQDQHPESGGLRLELFDGTDQHLPGLIMQYHQNLI